MKRAVIALALVACNNDIGSSGGMPGGAQSPVRNRGPAPDWSSKKLVAQDGAVDGVAFTIDVPDGLPRDARQGGDWETEDPKFDQAPKIFTQTIDVDRIQSMKDAKYNATLDSASKTWVRESARPDGWAVTYAEPDKTRIEAVTYRQVGSGPKYLKCKAVQASEKPLPSYDKTRAMLEAICESIKPKDAE